MDKKVKVYKKYFETADDKTALVTHRGYALKLVQIVEQLQQDYDHLKESFEFQTDLAVKGWEKVLELQQENEQLKNPQIWTNDGDL